MTDVTFTTTPSMDTTSKEGRAGLLRTALRLDAVVTAGNGAAYLAAAGPLGDLLGLSPSLLRAAGAFLLVYAAGVWATGARASIPRGAVIAVIVVNAIWALDSVLAAILGWGTPSTVGTVWIVAQALVVGGFAELQAVGLRRARRR